MVIDFWTFCLWFIGAQLIWHAIWLALGCTLGIDNGLNGSKKEEHNGRRYSLRAGPS